MQIKNLYVICVYEIHKYLEMKSFFAWKKIQRYANFKMKTKVIFDKIKCFVTEHVFTSQKRNLDTFTWIDVLQKAFGWNSNLIHLIFRK